VARRRACSRGRRSSSHVASSRDRSVLARPRRSGAAGRRLHQTGRSGPAAARHVLDGAAAVDAAADVAGPDVSPGDAAPAPDADPIEAGTGAADAPTVADSGESPTDAGVCSTTGATAKPLPVDIFVLLDRSGSMTTPIYGFPRDSGVTPSRWESITEALGNFVMSPASAGISVGLGYFPSTGFSECNITDYATPVVPIAPLPGVATAFMASVNMTYPTGGTPTLPALQGAVQYAQQREMTMGRRTAIALATDGEPNSCGSTLQSVSDVASMAAAKGIYTFVIGVGSSLQTFNALAAAGGTKMAYLVENATPDALAMAFKAIQLQASKLACSYTVPPPPPNEMLDPFRVNVRFTPTADPTKWFGIGMVLSRGDCGTMGGWYFDDLFAPTSVNLCDTSCQKVNGAGEGSISLQFGCKAN
jgi:hypothetical protein